MLQKVKCNPHLSQVMIPTSRTSSISDKANRSPQSTAGHKGTRTGATVERIQRWNCCNYFNLNLALAGAVSDTPLLGGEVPRDLFNDHEGLCCALQLKDAPSRAAGPRGLGLGMDADGTPARLPVDVICWTWISKGLFCHRAGQHQPDQVCTAQKSVRLALSGEKMPFASYSLPA